MQTDGWRRTAILYLLVAVPMVLLALATWPKPVAIVEAFTAGIAVGAAIMTIAHLPMRRAYDECRILWHLPAKPLARRSLPCKIGKCCRLFPVTKRQRSRAQQLVSSAGPCARPRKYNSRTGLRACRKALT